MRLSLGTGLAVLAEGAVPDPFDQFGPGKHGGWVRGEKRQQLELLEGELDLALVDPRAALRVVQEQPVAGWRLVAC